MSRVLAAVLEYSLNESEFQETARGSVKGRELEHLLCDHTSKCALPHFTFESYANGRCNCGSDAPALT